MDCKANKENIILSFKYSIKDKKHTIDFILNEKGNNKKTIENLFKKFSELSSLTWKDFINKPKETAYEMIPISSFNINLDNIKKELNLSDDSKIMVFRFDNQKKRLLGVRSKECHSILYIIGYDWNYSAYDHGN